MSTSGLIDTAASFDALPPPKNPAAAVVIDPPRSLRRAMLLSAVEGMAETVVHVVCVFSHSLQEIEAPRQLMVGECTKPEAACLKIKTATKHRRNFILRVVVLID
jgi:hypothetical protein